MMWLLPLAAVVAKKFGDYMRGPSATPPPPSGRGIDYTTYAVRDNSADLEEFMAEHPEAVLAPRFVEYLYERGHADIAGQMREAASDMRRKHRGAVIFFDNIRPC